MKKILTVRNIYNLHEEYLPLSGVLARVLGEKTRSGAWLIYGAEKNGKTTFALTVANTLSRVEKVLYVSAEEGVEAEFRQTMMRSGVSEDNGRIHFTDYTPVVNLEEYLAKRRAAKIIFIDNLTVYAEELKGGNLFNLIKTHSDKLFVFIAHEKNGEPYNATARMCKRLAKVIVRVRGLVAEVGGRCPGGRIIIDKSGASLALGEQTIDNNML